MEESNPDGEVHSFCTQILCGFLSAELHLLPYQLLLHVEYTCTPLLFAVSTLYNQLVHSIYFQGHLEKRCCKKDNRL